MWETVQQLYDLSLCQTIEDEILLTYWVLWHAPHLTLFNSAHYQGVASSEARDAVNVYQLEASQ